VINSILHLAAVASDPFRAMAGKLLNQALQIGDNPSATDEHRPLSYDVL